MGNSPVKLLDKVRLLFLYNHALDTDMPEDINALRSKKPVRVPTVMTRPERP
jgi:hypothetical protein